MPALLWVGAALVLAVIEVLSVDLFFLMLAIAALGAGAASAVGAGLVPQVAVFVVLALLLLLTVRPWAKRVLQASNPHVATNVHGLIGKPATVIEAVTREDGRIRLEGEVWSARCEDTSLYAPGHDVVVVRIDGATAIVTSA